MSRSQRALQKSTASIAVLVFGLNTMLAVSITAASAPAFAGSTISDSGNMVLAETRRMDRRDDRQDDRQEDRGDRRGDRDERGDTRQDCRQEEGAGSDKRDCKQEGREERRSKGN